MTSSIDSTEPIAESPMMDQLRAYHSALEEADEIDNGSMDDDPTWEVQAILGHKYNRTDGMCFKVQWYDGRKQWVNMDDMRFHDPMSII